MSKKCTALWREAHFEVKSVKNWGSRRHFGRSDVVLCGRWNGLCIHWKVTKTWGFCSIFKNDGRRGRFEGDLHRCIFRGRRSTRGIFSRDVRSSRSWFPERGCILAYQIISYGETVNTMIPSGSMPKWKYENLVFVSWTRLGPRKQTVFAFNRACVLSGRAADFAACDLVVTNVVVRTLDWWCFFWPIRVASAFCIGFVSETCNRSAVGTLAGISFGSTTFNGACVFSGRAPGSAACDLVVTSVVVGTLEWWCFFWPIRVASAFCIRFVSDSDRATVGRRRKITQWELLQASVFWSTSGDRRNGIW